MRTVRALVLEFASSRRSGNTSVQHQRNLFEVGKQAFLDIVRAAEAGSAAAWTSRTLLVAVRLKSFLVVPEGPIRSSRFFMCDTVCGTVHSARRAERCGGTRRSKGVATIDVGLRSNASAGTVSDLALLSTARSMTEERATRRAPGIDTPTPPCTLVPPAGFPPQSADRQLHDPPSQRATECVGVCEAPREAQRLNRYRKHHRHARHLPQDAIHMLRLQVPSAWKRCSKNVVNARQPAVGPRGSALAGRQSDKQ